MRRFGNILAPIRAEAGAHTEMGFKRVMQALDEHDRFLKALTSPSGPTLGPGGDTIIVHTSGAGLGLYATGGNGANAAINVGHADDTITVNADDIQVNQAFDFNWTGAHLWQPDSDAIPVTIQKTLSLTSESLMKAVRVDDTTIMDLSNDELLGLNMTPDASLAIKGLGETYTVYDESLITDIPNLLWWFDGSEGKNTNTHGAALTSWIPTRPTGADVIYPLSRVTSSVTSYTDADGFTGVRIGPNGAIAMAFGGGLASIDGSGNFTLVVVAAPTSSNTKMPILKDYDNTVGGNWIVAGGPLNSFPTNLFAFNPAGALTHWVGGSQTRTGSASDYVGIKALSIVGRYTVASVTNGLMIFNNTDYSVAPATGGTAGTQNASINAGGFGWPTDPQQDFVIYDALWFQRILTADEIDDIELFMRGKYQTGFGVTATSYPLTRWYTGSAVKMGEVSAAGYLGLGPSTTPTVQLDVLTTVGPQARFGYDTDSYTSLQIGSGSNPILYNLPTTSAVGVLHNTAPTGTNPYTSTWSWSAVSLTADVSGILPLVNGGTNAALTAINGGIVYSTASALAITSAGTSGDWLRSTGAGAPAFTNPAALTRVDDTNVTLTLGGSPTTALLNATSITAGWTGQLSIARGGTGQATATAAFNALSPLTTRGDLLTRDTTNNIRLAISTHDGYVLTSDGTDASWAPPAAGLMTALYRFDDTTTASDPGTGRLRFNTGAYSTVTEIYLDSVNGSDTDVSVVIGTMQAGDQFLAQDQATSTILVRYQLTATPTNNTGWWTIPVVFVASSGSFFINNQRLVIGVTAGAVGIYQPLDADLTEIAAVANVRGDLLVTNSGPTWVRLPIGTANQVLGVHATNADPEYKSIVGTTDEIDIAHTTGQIQIGLVNPLILGKGGTNAALTASNGGIVYSTSSALAILPSTVTGRVLRSGASAAPTWSTATYPDTAGTSGNVLTSDGTNWNSATLASAGIVAGSGTLNTLPLWTPDGNTLGNSMAFQVSRDFQVTATNSAGAGQAGKIILTTGSGTSGNTRGGDFNVTLGVGIGTQIGGGVNILGGTGGATGKGGSFDIRAGAGGGTSGDGGDFTLASGAATAGNSAGGLFQMLAGLGSGSGSGGAYNMSAGDGGATGSGGDFSLGAGTGGATSGNGGSFFMAAGSANAAGSGANAGGSFTMEAGDGADTGDGGAFSISSGSGGTNGGFGGDITIACGSVGASSADDGGSLTIQTGSGATTGNGGSLFINTGNGGSSSGSGGDVVIVTGSTTGGDDFGGDFIVTTGTGDPDAGPGRIQFTRGNGATVDFDMDWMVANRTYFWPDAGGIISTWDYIAPPSNTAVNSASDVTIVSEAVENLVAGDVVIVEGTATILNDSGASRTYTMTMDWDALFDIEQSTAGMTNSATNELVIFFKSVLSVRSTSLAYCTNRMETGAAAGTAGGADAAVSGVTPLQLLSWATTGSNATGSTTFTLLVRSTDATATQTFRLHSLTITRLSSVNP